MLTMVKVFAYGFITLMSLISATNIFNTINTNINLRRREIAVLQSAGMKNSDFTRMMSYECLIYGLKSLAAGIPVSLIISLVIYITVNNGINAAYIFPWKPLLISVIAIFTIVYSTMMYTMHKIKDQDVSSTMRQETF